MFLDGEAEIARHGSQLPHWQQGEVMQFVTFRLKDAMPQAKVREWKEERAQWLHLHPKPWTKRVENDYHRRFTDRLEQWLDAGSGSCLLKSAENRKILEEILMHDEGQRAVHEAWVIMPNHAHLLFTPKAPLEDLLKTWKGVSARRIGEGRIWQPSYRDTLIRDAAHYANAVRYIRRNPRGLPAGHFSLWESDRARAVS